GADAATPVQQAANLGLYGAATPAAVVRRWHLGGVILIDHNTLDPERPTLSTGNVDGAAQTTGLDAGLQRAARAAGDPTLLIATDQEGGQVQRITSGVAPRPSEESIAHESRATLRCGYYRLGRQLRALGVNQDFAPVADVVRTSTGVIGDRSFGPGPRLDSRDVVAAVAGLQRGGVLATLKHWPGHGSTSTDSHAALAVVTESAATWRNVDRVPFARAAGRAAAIMVGHLAVPALDPTGRPATFSPVLNARLLRRGLGFTGLVVTDSLWMEPARQQGSPGRTALRALRAGNDLLLEPPALPASYRAVLAAVRHRPAVRGLVRNAVGHVLAAKNRAARPPAAPPAGC
ncbi:MAG TPA: glycoside hydrolase family 3 N-terminal domain-containing protein, partial [Marmoricola sp.]|nr:glycoside hydrolase family 3 N-terminal domain-containing protein [Marmoricola sp.]